MKNINKIADQIKTSTVSFNYKAFDDFYKTVGGLHSGAHAPRLLDKLLNDSGYSDNSIVAVDVDKMSIDKGSIRIILDITSTNDKDKKEKSKVYVDWDGKKFKAEF